MKRLNADAAAMCETAEKWSSRLEYLVVNSKPQLFFWIALGLSGLCTLLKILPADDVFSRYAPAAEAFARGDWRYAFHPRFGVYFTSFAGILVWLFPCSGVAASQLLSMLCFSLAIFPLHALFREIWGKPTAFWGTLCYVFCSHLLRYAGEGLRDNGKTLALAMIAMAFVSLCRKTTWQNVIVFSAGNALLTVIRGEVPPSVRGFSVNVILSWDTLLAEAAQRINMRDRRCRTTAFLSILRLNCRMRN